MKPVKYSLLTVFLMVFIIAACEKEKQDITVLNPVGKVSHVSECKNLKSAFVVQETPDTLSCVEYAYNDTTGILEMKHVNSGFNCCPGNIYAVFKCSSDSIIIQEYETTPGCHCNCLYDLDFEIKGISKKKYEVVLIEPYIGELDKLEFELDLSDAPRGSVCVERHSYPWGMN